MKSRRSRASTAVELLVVAGVLIVIAVGVLVPIINRARYSPSRERARQSACNSNVRQLAIAIQMYAQDNNSQYPGIDGSSWVSKIEPYLGAGISGSGTLTVGGEYAARPLLLAAAQMYGAYKSPGFAGQHSTAGRPRQNWAWGTVSGAKGPSSPAIAYDALLFIVSKGSRIPTLPPLANWTFTVDAGLLHDAFAQGCVANSVQVYCMSGSTATDAYARSIAKVTRYGKGALEVKNDFEMVEKVANDPYGIGYCSSAFADPDRVIILAFAGLGTDGNDAVWPRASTKFRWVMPTYSESNWPWKRSVNLVTSKRNTALEKNVAAALRGGALSVSLGQGPLFTYGYWPGDY